MCIHNGSCQVGLGFSWDGKDNRFHALGEGPGEGTVGLRRPGEKEAGAGWA